MNIHVIYFEHPELKYKNYHKFLYVLEQSREIRRLIV